MRYTVVEETCVEALIYEVNKLITEGWEPIGGISITLSEDEENRFYRAAQALVKRAT